MTLSRSQKQRSLAGVIAAMAVVNLVYGIAFPLLALVLDAQHVSKTLIGLSTISQALAIFFIAPVAPRLLARIPAARLMQYSTVLLALLFVLAGWFPNVYFWFPLRFVMGAMTALLWISSEALINELAPESARGRIIGIYTSVGSAGFALGPLLLVVTGSEGMVPFYSTGSLILLAGIPLFLVLHPERHCEEDAAVGIWKVFLLAPTIMLANIAYAASAESILTFFPLFGMHLGLSEEFSLWLMTLMGFGSMVLLLPLGWLADHVNRIGLLVGILLLTMAGLLAMPSLIQQTSLAMPFAFLFGGIEGMIYALGVMLVGERFKGAMLAAASTVFTTCWGVGSVIGPLVVGAGMDRFGPQSMTWIIFLMFAVYLPLPLTAWIRTGKKTGA
jgi:MFS family permease